MAKPMVKLVGNADGKAAVAVHSGILFSTATDWVALGWQICKDCNADHVLSPTTVFEDRQGWVWGAGKALGHLALKRLQVYIACLEMGCLSSPRGQGRLRGY